jgi:putative FmdB family regulatory protein
MPTYEYECKSCAYTFEVFQSMSDKPVTQCPQCGRGVRRLIHGGTGVIFKGSGFYVTDKNKGGNSVKPGKPAGVPSDNGSNSGAGAAASDSGAKPEKTAPGTQSAAPASTAPKTPASQKPGE